jgi:hypothetical protein
MTTVQEVIVIIYNSTFKTCRVRSGTPPLIPGSSHWHFSLLIDFQVWICMNKGEAELLRRTMFSRICWLVVELQSFPVEDRHRRCQKSHKVAKII